MIDYCSEAIAYELHAQEERGRIGVKRIGPFNPISSPTKQAIFSSARETVIKSSIVVSLYRQHFHTNSNRVFSNFGSNGVSTWMILWLTGVKDLA